MVKRDDRWLETVPFLPFTCPRCRSLKLRTQSVNRSPNQATMRYHSCKNCGNRFRSVQITRDDIRKWLPDADRIELGRRED